MNKNGNKLLDKISDLDPKLISDAEKKPRGAKRRLFIGITSGMATAAAAAVIAVAAAHNPLQEPPVVSGSDPVISDSVSDPIISDSDPVISDSGSTSSTQNPQPFDPPEIDFSKYKDLPKISDSNYSVTAMGGGETRYFNRADLKKRSPWNGEELETMPVYMSSSINPDLDKMYARVKEIAAALGLSADTLEITDNYDSQMEKIEEHRELMRGWGKTEEEIDQALKHMINSTFCNIYVTAAADGVEIRLNTAFCAYITFAENIIPEGYNFSKDATAEEKEELLNYLADKYKELLQYGKPMPGKTDSMVYFSIFDSDGDITHQIVNYWINHADFISENEIWLYSDGGCEKLGDYPILTAAQAEAILKSNKYDDNFRMPADAVILKTDIEYLNFQGRTAVMPYYKFYVETADEPYDDHDIVCDIYTIPAVPEEFIDMETEDYGNHAGA